MSKPDKESTRKAVVHWMDTMKERLDHYEVHRNEFLSDMRLPPRNVKFLREVLLPFCENTLLLDNIAKSEGLCYEPGGAKNRLTIRVRIDGKEVKTTYPELQSMEGAGGISYPENFPFLLKHACFDKNPKDNTLAVGLNGKVIKAGSNECDFEICLPHEHAVYSILENVIRNSAKHNAGKFKLLNASGVQGQPNGKAADGEDQLDTLDIHVDITDAGADHWHCTIYDNVSQVRHGVAETGAERMADLTDMLERKNKPLLADGKPNRANMGMADMKINAFLLKSARDFSEDDLNEALDFVICDRCTDGGHEHTVVRLDKEKQVKKVVWEKDTEVEKEAPRPGAHFFGYRFKLTKAKKVAWIGKEAEAIAKNDDYKRAGIYGYPTWEDYTMSQCETLAAYEIAVLEREAWEGTEKEQEVKKKDEGKWKRDRLAQLSFRVLVLAGRNDVSVPEPFDRRIQVGSLEQEQRLAESFLEHALKEWIRLRYMTSVAPVRLLACFDGNTAEKRALKVDGILDGWFFWRHGAYAMQKETIELASSLGKTVSVDHHGDLSDSCVCFKEHEGIGFVKWNALRNSYGFMDKGNRDQDGLVHAFKTALGTAEEAPLLLQVADAYLRRILVVDERVAQWSQGAKPAKARLVAGGMWSFYSSANIHVVTRLSTAADSLLLTAKELDDKHAGIHLDLTNGTPQITLKCAQYMFNETEGVAKDLKVNEVDILLLHRTYWLKMTAQERDMVQKAFPSVIITSGAGEPADIEGCTFLPFSVLCNYVSGTSLAKLGLMKTLNGLSIKAQKT